MSRLSADLLLLLTAGIWGVAFLFQKSAMEHVGVFTFIAGRSAVAVLVLLPFLWLERRRAPRAPGAGRFRLSAAGGVAFFIAAWLQQAGLVTASVTSSAFLTSLYVVCTPLIVWLLSRAVPARAVWVAVVLAMAGTFLLGGGRLDGLGTGDWLVTASAVFWAMHMVITSRAGLAGVPVAYTTLQFVVVGVLGGLGTVLAEPVTLAGLAAAAPEFLFVGGLSSALTFTLLAVALRHTPASEAAILVSTETLFAAAAGALWLGERLTPIGYAGAALMLLATLTVQRVAGRSPSPAVPES